MSQVIAEIKDFPSLLQGFRERIQQLHTTYDAVDDAAFLTDGHTSKLLKKYPEKRMNVQTFGGMLQGLGCKLLLVEDAEQMAKVAGMLRREKWSKAHREARAANGGQRTVKTPKKRAQNAFKGDSEWGRNLRMRAMVLTTPKCRQRAARKAGKVAARRARLRRKLMELAAGRKI